MNCIAISNSYKYIFAGGSDNKIRYWEISEHFKFKLSGCFSGHSDMISCIKNIELENLELIKEEESKKQENPSNLRNFLISSSYDATISVMQFPNRLKSQLLKTFSPTGISSFDIHPQRKLLLINCLNGILEILNLKSFQ